MVKIFVAALKEETPELNKFYHTGVGKINASIKLMELIHEHNPTQVINYGTAGSLKKEINGLIECTTFVQHDMDARGLLNFKLGETPFDSISTITMSHEGYTCGTGDKFVKHQLELECDIVDMEAYALAKVCKIHKIEFKCYKYISDYANDESSNDWIENCHKGAGEFLSLYPECK